MYKTFPDVRRRICRGYIKQSLSGHSSDGVNGFKFHGCLRERYRWQEIRRTGGCAWSPCVSRAVLVSGSVTKMNRRRLPPPVAVRDYIGCGCSARYSVHVNKCFEKTDNADTRCDNRPPTTPDFKGSCRRLSWGVQLAVAVQGRAIIRFTSFTPCNKAYCDLMSFLNSIPRILILERE